MWRALFMAAAFFNLAVGAAMLAVPDRVGMHLSVGGAGEPFVVACLGVLLAAFGVGYLIVARDPAHNRGIVWMGIVEKAGVSTLAAMQFGAGIVPFRYFALSMVDVAFLSLFVFFLWRRGWSMH